MKKIGLFLVLSFAFFSCDDGDLTLDEIDLTSAATPRACRLEAGVTLLFKINGAETLILDIPADLIVNTVTPVEMMDDELVNIPRTKTLNGQATCLYRSFDSTITEAYFCDELPSDINITLEYTAVSGTVEVTTVEILTGGAVTEYEHTINLREVVFTGTNGQDVRYDLFEFGDIRTPVQ